MNFLIKYASRGRSVWFIRAIENITSTIKTDKYQILVSADIDDSTMNHDDVKKFISLYPQVKIVYGKSESKIHAVNRDMEQADPWDVLINFSDDMFFIVHGWDKIMEEYHSQAFPHSLDFFAHWNDGYLGDKLPTMSIMGRAYYERDGYIYHPSYKSFSCDAEALYVSQMRERYHYFDKILFKHEHPANNKTVKNDETYRISSLATDHDTKNYWERLRRYFDEPVTELTPIPFRQHL